MFRLQVKFRGKWIWGINEYDSLESAEARISELSKVGIKARIKKSEEFYN